MVGNKEYPEGTGRNKKEAKEAAAKLVYLQVEGGEMSEVCDHQKFYQITLYNNKASISTSQQLLNVYLVKEWFNNTYNYLR